MIDDLDDALALLAVGIAIGVGMVGAELQVQPLAIIPIAAVTATLTTYLLKLSIDDFSVGDSR